MLDVDKLGLSPWAAQLVRSLDFGEGQITKKLWGCAVAINDSDYGQMSLAIIDQHGYCSRHYHNQKINAFHVLRGSLIINLWSDDVNQIETRQPDMRKYLEAGESASVPINVIHQFQAETDCICMEAYYTIIPEHRVSLDDIHRFTQGGCTT